MLTCKHTSRLISEAQERQLSLRERINLRLHVWMCNNCRHFEQQIVTMRKIMQREWTQVTPPTDNQLPGEARERIRQTLKENIKQSNNQGSSDQV